MFKLDHMGFFSVLHNIGGCLLGKKIWEPQHFGKTQKDEANLDKLKNYFSFRVAGAQTLGNVFLKLHKNTCLVIA